MRIFVIIFVFVLSNSIWAQTKVEKYSFNPKIGMSYDVNSETCSSYGLAFNVFGEKNLYSIYYQHHDEIEIFGNSDPKENINDFGLLIGRYIGEKYLRFNYQFGLSVFWGVNRGERTYYPISGYQYDVKKYNTIGFPLKFGVKVIPFRFMSIGLDFQANINFERTVFMTLISLEFGLLRNEIVTRPID